MMYGGKANGRRKPKSKGSDIAREFKGVVKEFDVEQFGSLDTPMVINMYGHVNDINRETTSGSVLISDSETMAMIDQLDLIAAKYKDEHMRRYPGVPCNYRSLLKNNIDAMSAATKCYHVRVKFTKDESAYECKDPWSSNAATSLCTLEAGHKIVARGGVGGWTFTDSDGSGDGNTVTYGVTLFLNRVMCTGKVDEAELGDLRTNANVEPQAFAPIEWS
jgi:hypothetical protein